MIYWLSFPKKYSTSEIRITCSDEKKLHIVEAVKKSFEEMKDIEVMTIDGIRVIMQHGWGMLRPSNTQPVLCLRFEADSQEALHDIKKVFLTQLQPYFATTILEVIQIAP